MTRIGAPQNARAGGVGCRQQRAGRSHGKLYSSAKHNLDDDIWLSEVGKNGWLVFSYDAKWQDESAAVAAIKQHKVGCFYLHGASSLSFDRLASFVRSYEKIMGIAKTEKRPYIFAFDSRNQAKRLL